MSSEFLPQDFRDFQNDKDAMARYKTCAERCLLFNFGGSIPPVIQNIVSDVHEGCTDGESGRCNECPLTEKERRLAVLLLIDAML